MFRTIHLLPLLALMAAASADHASALTDNEQQAAFFELLNLDNGVLLQRNPGLASVRAALSQTAPDYAAAETALMASIPVNHYSCGPSAMPADAVDFAREFFRRIDLDTPGLAATKNLVLAEDWEGALAAWRDYTVAKLRGLSLPPLYQQSYKTHPRQTSIASLLLGEISRDEYVAGGSAQGGIDFYDIYGMAEHPPGAIDWLAQPLSADTSQDSRYSYANFSFAGGLVFRYHTGPIIAGAQGNSFTITGAGQSVVAVFPSAHGLSSGDLIQITGASPSAYNGLFRVQVIDPQTISYTTATPVTVSPATGSGRRATRTREAAALQKWFAIAADFSTRQKNLVSPLNLSLATTNRALYRTIWQGADWSATASSALSQGDRATEMLAAISLFCKLLPEVSTRQVDWNAAPSLPATAPLAPGSEAIVPAQDLARIVFSLMADTPEALVLRYFKAGAVPNQRLNGLHALYMLGTVFHEFKAASGLSARTDAALGLYADEMFYPDGSMLERSPNYNEGDAAQIREITATTPALPSSGVGRLAAKLRDYEESTAWMANPLGALPRLATYAPPSYPELWRGPAVTAPWRQDTILKTSFLASGNTNALAIWRGLLDSGLPVPGTTSMALPYAGYYAMRNGWGSRASYLHFANTPPGRGHRQLDQNGIQLTAFGRELLTTAGPPPYDPTFVDSSQSSDFAGFASFLGEASSFKCNTVSVDGSSQNEGNTVDNIAARLPRQVPWLATRDFDFVEGVYEAGYAGTNVYNPLLAVGDTGAARTGVSHRRSIVFAKQAGVWLITDRMSSSGATNRSYRQTWNFPTRRDSMASSGPTNLSGFVPDEIQADQGTRTIRTASVSGPNVSLHHLGPAPVAYETFTASRAPYLGWFGTGLSGVRLPTKNVHAVFGGTGSQLLATLIIPSDTGATRAAPSTNGPLAGPRTADANLTLADGTDLRFVASQDPVTLRLGHADVTAQTVVTVSAPGQPLTGMVAGASDIVPTAATGRFFAVESFRYPQGALLSTTTASNASGWLGGWKSNASLAGNLPSSYAVSAGSITNAPDRLTISPGNHLAVQGNGTGGSSEIVMYRRLAEPVDLARDRDHFLSFVLRMPDDTSTSIAAQARLELLDPATQSSASTFFGAGALDATSKEMRIRGRLLGVNFVTTKTALLGQNYLIVARLKGSTNGSKQVWVRAFGPGEIPAEPADWGTPDATSTATNSLSLPVLGCRATFYTGHRLSVDEIRCGETWAEATGASHFTFSATPGDLRPGVSATPRTEIPWKTAATNTPPRITPPVGQSVTSGALSVPLTFTVDDSETAASLLGVTANSSDPAILPADGIQISGSGSRRTVSVGPAPGASGSVTVWLTASDGALNGSASFQVQVTSPSDLDTWKAGHFGPSWQTLADAGDDADPDADGVPNLLEYASGAHPLTPDARSLETVRQGGEFLVRYRRAKRAQGVTLSVMRSADLAGWTAEGVSAPLLLPDGSDETTDLLEVRLPFAGSALFARLHAARLP